MSYELRRSQDSEQSQDSGHRRNKQLQHDFRINTEGTAVERAEFTQKQEYKKMGINLGEMQLLYNGFQKNFGNGKALPSSFKPGENFSKFIQNYNDQRDKYAKELPRVNAQIDAYNRNLAEGVSKVLRLQLPPKLESFKPRSSEAEDLVKVSEKRSSGSYWDALKSMDSTRVLKLCKAAFVAVLLASCPTDAVRIQGKGCSIESTLQFTGVDPYFSSLPDELLDFLPHALQEQYNRVAPPLAKHFAANPCDPSFENVIVNFDHLRSGVLGEADVDRKEIWLDPHKDVMALEALFTHEVAHLFQAYPPSMSKHYKWLEEGMADYAQYKFCPPAEEDDWQLLLVIPEDQLRDSDGSERVAGFLFWLEQRKRKDIVDSLNRRMQRGRFTEKAFLELTGQTVDELWGEYKANQAEEIQKIEKQEKQAEEIQKIEKQEKQAKEIQKIEKQEKQAKEIQKIEKQEKQAEEIQKIEKQEKQAEEIQKIEKQEKQAEEIQKIEKRAKCAAFLFIVGISVELVRRSLKRRASRSLADPLSRMEQGEMPSQGRKELHEA